MIRQNGLGRGLASLIPPKKTEAVSFDAAAVNSDVAIANVPSEGVAQDDRGRVTEVSVHDIVPNPHQPRLYFSAEKLAELSASIKEHGILQPLIVTKNAEGKHELIAGERRFQSAKLAGLETVPVIVREAKEQEKFELAIIENIHRHDLNPIEEAKAYRKLMDEFGLTQEEVSRKVGKSRSAVANTVRLLQLPVEAQRAVAEGKVSEGHAKAIAALPTVEKQLALLEMILSQGLTVREAEARVQEVSVKSYRRAKGSDPAIKEKEEQLADVFGTKVKIHATKNGGKITIDYYSEEDLAHLITQLTQ